MSKSTATRQKRMLSGASSESPSRTRVSLLNNADEDRTLSTETSEDSPKLKTSWRVEAAEPSLQRSDTTNEVAVSEMPSVTSDLSKSSADGDFAEFEAALLNHLKCTAENIEHYEVFMVMDFFFPNKPPIAQYNGKHVTSVLQMLGCVQRQLDLNVKDFKTVREWFTGSHEMGPFSSMLLESLKSKPVLRSFFTQVHLYKKTLGHAMTTLEYDNLIRGWRSEVKSAMEVLGRRIVPLKERFTDKGFAAAYLSDPYDVQDFFSTLYGMIEDKTSYPPGIKMETTSLEFYAPYTAVIQSSRCGKSRFLLQPKIDEKTVALTVYIGCSSVGSSCFHKLMQKLEKSSFDSAMVVGCSFFVKIALKMIKRYFRDGYLVELPTTGICLDELMNNYQPWFDGEQDYENAVQLVKRDIGSLKYVDQNGKVRNVIICVAFDDAHVLVKENIIFRAQQGTIEGSIRKETKFENSETDSVFRRLRRALGYLNTSSSLCIPSYFASTQLLLGSFPPAVEYDASRAFEYGSDDTTNTKKYLHRPLLLHGTFDIFHNQPVDQYIIDPHTTKNWISVLKDDVYVYHLLTLGRPIWKSLSINPILSIPDISRVIGFLKSKVSPPRSFISPSALEQDLNLLKQSRVFSLMVMGRTAYLPNLVHSQHYSEALLNNQMAYLVDFEEVDGSSLVGFPAEPMLSGMACTFLMAHFSTVVRHLCAACSRVRTIDIGEHGELLARLILVSAVQRAEPVPDAFADLIRPDGENNTFMKCFAPRTIDALLGSLSKNLLSVLRQQNVMPFGKDDLVSFTHWKPLAKMGTIAEYVFRKDRNAFEMVLRGGLKRNCAYIFPAGFEALDLMIPVAMSRPASDLAQPLSALSLVDLVGDDYGEDDSTRRMLRKTIKMPKDPNERLFLNDDGSVKQVKLEGPRECGAILIQIKNVQVLRYGEIVEKMTKCWPTSNCLRLCINVNAQTPKISVRDGVVFLEGIDSLDSFNVADREALTMLLLCYDQAYRQRIDNRIIHGGGRVSDDFVFDD